MSLAREFKNKALFPIILTATMFGHNAAAQSIDGNVGTKKEKVVLNAFPKVDVAYQHDTLDMFSSTSAYYDPDNNSITANIFESNWEEKNAFNTVKSTIAHEYKHFLDDTVLNMSLEQWYKTSCNKEIAANIAELLQLRDEYIHSDSSGQQKIRESVAGRQFNYYFDAIDSGKINPFATTADDLRNELIFIGRETKEMWMNNFAQIYDSNHTDKSLYFFQTHNYENLKPNDENYQFLRDKIFTIGGFNFGKCFDDIDITNINHNVSSADKLIGEGKTREAVEITLRNQRVYSLQEKYNEMLLHQVIFDVELMRLVYMDCPECIYNPEIVEMAEFNDIAQEWAKAVENGQIVPEYKMNEDEQKWLAEKISEKISCSVPPMDALFDYYISEGHDALYASANIESHLEYPSINTTIGDVDFQWLINLPQNSHLKELDDKIKNDEHLTVEDFTYGQSPQIVKYVKRRAKRANRLNRHDTDYEAEIIPDSATESTYDTVWREDHRVSGILYTNVLDLSSNFLADELSRREEQEQLHQRIANIRQKITGESGDTTPKQSLNVNFPAKQLSKQRTF